MPGGRMGGEECHAKGSRRDDLFDFGSLVEVGDPHWEFHMRGVRHRRRGRKWWWRRSLICQRLWRCGWVGSCKVPSPALGRGEVLLKCTQCCVFETLQLVLYKQATTVI